MDKFILISLLFLSVNVLAVTAYDYSSGQFVVLPDTTNPSFNTVVISSLTVSSATVSNLVFQVISKTLSQIQASTGTIGALIYCSNCVTDAVCVATGTIGGYVRVSSKTVACQ